VRRRRARLPGVSGRSVGAAQRQTAAERDRPAVGPHRTAVEAITWHARPVTVIRPADPATASRLQEIERRSGVQFRDVGMDDIADDEPLAADVLAAYARAGRSWVALDGADVIVGYTLVDLVDGCAHIEQVSVVPEYQGQGVGRLLLDQVRSWAVGSGCPAVTLTTFDAVPWNRPLYEHLGFRVLGESELGPELRALRATEAAHGLDPAERVCMRLDLR
jgi:GNAT superfamily N-acetyltransferase